MLAEALHKCVYELDAMPVAEYMNWMAYFEEKNRRREAANGNLLAMDEDDMIEKFTNA